MQVKQSYAFKADALAPSVFLKFRIDIEGDRQIVFQYSRACGRNPDIHFARFVVARSVEHDITV